MAISYWETEQTFFEARIYTNQSLDDFVDAIDVMTKECIAWNGDVKQLKWEIDGDAVVIRFPGGSEATGWEPRR